MEGVPYFPESSPDDDKESSAEKKGKKDSKEKKLSIFEKLEKEDKKNFELFADDKAEKKDDKELPAEKLADTEEQAVVSKAAEVVADGAVQELSEALPETPEEQEALVAATFAEALNQEIEKGTPAEQAIDNAENQTLEIADIEPLEPEPEPDAEVEPDIEEPIEAGDDPTDIEDDPAVATPAAASGSGGGRPPIVPPTPMGPLSGGPPVTPHIPGVSNAAQEVVVVHDRRKERANLLVGGLVGYFVGRRRGRIKTENKLLPVQEKLEKQVKDLTQQVFEREEKLRHVARAQHERDPAASKKTIERMHDLQELKKSEEVKKQTKKPEKLGKFAVLAERPGKTQEKAKSVDVMTMPELLEIAATVSIEQSTVKRLYETNRINEQGLRRVLRSYLRGERYDHVLHENLLSPEVYRNPEKLNEAPSSQTSDIKKALQDFAAAPSFALPSLNHTQQAADQPSYVPYQKPQKSLKPLVGGFVIGLAILIIIWFAT